ncbi:hypothetical protein BDQ17DRAFT_1370709 [Cyathus striatus]|nr:hypothetical protein BDQ17DRAFT_1370709 [Cyathus striatus]
MIGTWISALRLFPNKTIEFETTDPYLHDEPVHKVVPPPYLPEVVDTDIIEDIEGWHNFQGRRPHIAPISWNSVCIHHVDGNEMKVLRHMDEIRAEWE